VGGSGRRADSYTEFMPSFLFRPQVTEPETSPREIEKLIISKLKQTFFEFATSTLCSIVWIQLQIRHSGTDKVGFQESKYQLDHRDNATLAVS
jgi:hypothetical protein